MITPRGKIQDKVPIDPIGSRYHPLMSSAPHPFTLRQLQYVIAVAEERSFRRAAERCHVAQPSLSAQVAQLEEALGVVLFERGARSVMVTSKGEELVARARDLLAGADAILEAARRAKDPLSGTLRIGVIPTISPYLLPKAAPALRAAFPALTTAWREDKTASLVAALKGAEIDAALVALEADIGDLEREVIAKDPFCWAGPREHPLASGKGAVDPEELRSDKLLLLDDGHCFREQALDVCANAGARESELRATSLATLVQMVAGGAGATLLPALAVATEAPRAGLAVRPLAAPEAARTLALVWRRSSPIAPALRAIAAAIRDAYPASKAPSKRER